MSPVLILFWMLIRSPLASLSNGCTVFVDSIKRPFNWKNIHIKYGELSRVKSPLVNFVGNFYDGWCVLVCMSCCVSAYMHTHTHSWNKSLNESISMNILFSCQFVAFVDINGFEFRYWFEMTIFNWFKIGILRLEWARIEHQKTVCAIIKWRANGFHCRYIQCIFTTCITCSGRLKTSLNKSCRQYILFIENWRKFFVQLIITG